MDYPTRISSIIQYIGFFSGRSRYGIAIAPTKSVRPLTQLGAVKGKNLRVDNSIPSSIFGFDETAGRYSLFNFGFAEQCR